MGPPGVIGAPGATGLRSAIADQALPPNGMNQKETWAMPMWDEIAAARSTIAWSGRSAADGVRTMMLGAAVFQAAGVVIHTGWLKALSLPYRSVWVTA